jgi:hypothetical protein
MVTKPQKRAWQIFIRRLIFTGVFAVMAGMSGSAVITGIMLVNVGWTAYAFTHLLRSYEP